MLGEIFLRIYFCNNKVERLQIFYRKLLLSQKQFSILLTLIFVMKSRKFFSEINDATEAMQ